MGKVYFLTEKGRKNEPKNPEGRATLEYCKDGHCPVNDAEIHQMVPGVSNPALTLDELARAGFLRKDQEDDKPQFGISSV